MSDIQGRRIAFLVTNGYEPSELTSPWDTVTDQGGEAVLVSPESDKVSSGDHSQKVDLHVAEAKAEDFDALVLPGGTKNADKIRMDQDSVNFTRAFFDANKTVASICHAAWILTEADVVKDRNMTSYPSLQTDLRNAGANWSDEELVVDGNLITSRTPDDLPAFNEAIINKLTEEN
ncbi:type 1 glutamine amidotransferase domain-containing protein [Enteractinococcus fodinae]|uniref:Protease I n=1 Tax=Enteractinococcus fodinae TaxID=684663 RepID=A0ABU2B401_9MICC|nr:type 1 glutamine amidotransferase domain-containing protein [Enteractinococcus fodinae]MDR7347523.1 protease I [Enteractinococcus fodinae]